ncbi:hypothetical protein BGX38DRAFT_1223412 [Terfezia claveryi]|nr:hypothetical protein BGX38DRAFT_1223412 [Terfezia claveryi]
MPFLPALFISRDTVASLVFLLSIIVPPLPSSSFSSSSFPPPSRIPPLLIPTEVFWQFPCRAQRTGSSMSNTLHTLLCCSLMLTEYVFSHSPFSRFLRSIFSPAPILFSKSFACLYCEIMTLRWFLVRVPFVSSSIPKSFAYCRQS